MKQRFHLRIRLVKNGRMRVKMELNNIWCKLNIIRILMSVVSTLSADGAVHRASVLGRCGISCVVVSLRAVAAKCTWEYRVNV
jgi:hypothetical protein